MGASQEGDVHPSLAYRADVDGLRALAVLAVLFYHAGFGFSGGYVGVDVFFVISGYLITGLLLKEHEGAGFRLLPFWERRIRRILPPLALVVSATLAAGWFLLLPQDLLYLGRSVLAQGLMISNVHFLTEAGYFDHAAELKPLLHTWSLAVEEQFYLFFPLLFALFRRMTRRVLAVVIMITGGISLGLSVWWAAAHPLGNFYLLPTRGWELLTGAMVAVWRGAPTRRGCAEAAGWGGLACILAPMFLYDHHTRFPGLTALPPCLGTAALIWANRATVSSTGRLLSARPLVWIGKISYSLYLWHWPLLALARYSSFEPLSSTQRVALLAASAVLAALSWRFVETPFRTGRLKGRPRATFAFAAAVTAWFTGIGAMLMAVRGAPARVPEEAPGHAARSRADIDALEQQSYLLDLDRARAGAFPLIGRTGADRPLDILVWGDSHASAAMPVIEALCADHGLRGATAMYAGTAPLIGFRSNGLPGQKSLAFNDAVLAHVRDRRPAHVLLAAKWGGYIDQHGDIQVVRAGLERTLHALDATGARVWILRQVPKPRTHVPRSLGVAILHGRDPGRLAIPQEDHLRDKRRQDPLFAGLAEAFPFTRVLDPAPLFAEDAGYRLSLAGEALYCDDSHLSRAGALALRPLLEPVFAAMPGTSPDRQRTRPEDP